MLFSEYGGKTQAEVAVWIRTYCMRHADIPDYDLVLKQLRTLVDDEDWGHVGIEMTGFDESQPSSVATFSLAEDERTP